MDDTPVISIIIPVFNGAPFVTSCIENLHHQNYEEMEIVFVIDHKTTDNTIEIVKGLMESDSRIRFIIQDDNGRLGFARNLGFENSIGRYVWFLDVDDCPHPSFIKEMVGIMDETSSDITFCNFYSSKNADFPKMNGDYSVITLERRDALRYRASGKLPVTSWSMVFRRELIENNGLKFKSGLAEDLDYVYRALNVCKKVSYYNKPLYLYRFNPNSICNGESGNRRASEELSVYQNLLDFFRNNDSDFYPYFKDKAILSSMRCMVHFDKKSFLDEYKKGWVRGMLIEMKKNKPFAETFIFKHFPRLYYSIVSRGMKAVFKETMFDNNVSCSFFKRWFNRNFKNI
jgi:glycosyltransferase involved in cell wall biosynthesis